MATQQLNSIEDETETVTTVTTATPVVAAKPMVLPKVTTSVESIKVRKGRRSMSGATELLEKMVPYIDEETPYSHFIVSTKSEASGWYQRAAKLGLRMATRKLAEDQFKLFIKADEPEQAED